MKVQPVGTRKDSGEEDGKLYLLVGMLLVKGPMSLLCFHINAIMIVWGGYVLA